MMEKMKDNSTFGVSLYFCESIRLEEENISELFSKGFQTAKKNHTQQSSVSRYIFVIIVVTFIIIVNIIIVLLLGYVLSILTLFLLKMNKPS